jgi:hypothetical protein
MYLEEGPRFGNHKSDLENLIDKDEDDLAPLRASGGALNQRKAVRGRVFGGVRQRK